MRGRDGGDGRGSRRPLCLRGRIGARIGTRIGTGSDALMADLAATPTLTLMTATMTTSSLRQWCPIPPSSIGSIPGSVPPTLSCCGGMYLNLTKTVTPCGRTQTWTVVPSLLGLINGTLWQGMGRIGGGA